MNRNSENRGVQEGCELTMQMLREAGFQSVTKIPVLAAWSLFWLAAPEPPADARIIKVEETVYKRAGIDPIILPRNAGSWPGYVFTGEPLKLPAGHFGLGHGSGAHAPSLKPLGAPLAYCFLA